MSSEFARRDNRLAQQSNKYGRTKACGSVWWFCLLSRPDAPARRKASGPPEGFTLGDSIVATSSGRTMGNGSAHADETHPTRSSTRRYVCSPALLRNEEIELSGKMEEVEPMPTSSLFSDSVKHMPIGSADAHLNELLIGYCEDVVLHREVTRSAFRS